MFLKTAPLWDYCSDATRISFSGSLSPNTNQGGKMGGALAQLKNDRNNSPPGTASTAASTRPSTVSSPTDTRAQSPGTAARAAEGAIVSRGAKPSAPGGKSSGGGGGGNDDEEMGKVAGHSFGSESFAVSLICWMKNKCDSSHNKSWKSSALYHLRSFHRRFFNPDRTIAGGETCMTHFQ